MDLDDAQEALERLKKDRNSDVFYFLLSEDECMQTKIENYSKVKEIILQ